MPGVSDPGARLVAAARGAGAAVEVVPGPSAVTAAMAASGVEAIGFLFGGFLPSRPASARGQGPRAAAGRRGGRRAAAGAVRGAAPRRGAAGSARRAGARRPGGCRSGAHQAPRGGAGRHAGRGRSAPRQSARRVDAWSSADLQPPHRRAPGLDVEAWSRPAPRRPIAIAAWSRCCAPSDSTRRDAYRARRSASVQVRHP